MVQVSGNYDSDTFAEAYGHHEWDIAMKEEYHSLLANDTWDLVPLSKGINLSDANGFTKQSMDQMVKLINKKLD